MKQKGREEEEQMGREEEEAGNGEDKEDGEEERFAVKVFTAGSAARAS